jgi:tetratricopeptide (TPR) repeat protein
MLVPGEVPASLKPRSLLILPFQTVAFEPNEEWVGEGVAQSLALAFAQHPGFIQVDRSRLKRLGQPELWGEPAVLAAARSLKADVALFGEIHRGAGEFTLRPRYLEVKSGGGEGYALDPAVVPEGRLLDALPGLALGYFRSLRVALTEGEATKVAKAARPTASLRAFETFVRGRMAAFKGTQDGNEAAADLFARAAELDPGFAVAQYSLGTVQLALGNRWKAAAQFRASIQLDPTLPEPYKSLGDLFIANPRRLFDQAVEAYQKAVDLRPFYAEAYVGLGDAKAAKGDTDGAIVYYKKALAYNPASPKVHLSLGKMYYGEKGLYYEAVASYKKAIELDAHFLDALMGLGEVYEDKGLYKEAIGEYQRVVELDPKHTGALYNLALVFEKVDAKEAITHWERYIATASQLPSEKDWVDVARQHLKKLRGKLERGQ